MRLTQRLAAILDVPLRYPLRFANSRSAIYSHAPPAGTVRYVHVVGINTAVFLCAAPSQPLLLTLQKQCQSVWEDYHIGTAW